jgi:hypothetical protein
VIFKHELVRGGAFSVFAVNARITHLNAPPKEALGERAPMDENEWFVCRDGKILV